LEADLADALPNASCRAEEPSGFAVTAGLTGQDGEALEDVRDVQVGLRLGAERERIVGVMPSLVRLTCRDRHAGARAQRRHQPPAGRGRHGLVGPTAGGGEIALC
jgi:hypothetical protein